MSYVGLYIELKAGALKRTNLELLTLIRRAGREALAVLFAEDVKPYLEELRRFGAGRIVQVTGLDGGYHPDRYSRSLAEIIEKHELGDFAGAHSAQGKDLLPRLAARLEAPLVTDCIAVDFDKRIATKPVYAGRIIAQVRLSAERRLYTLRPNTLTPEEAAQAVEPQIETQAAGSDELLFRIREVVAGLGKGIDLTEARVIVSGGRGLKNAANFKLLQELAGVLGAAVGASRAAVDSEYASQSMQVGQTGKTVSPVLYIACGISGAAQHLAGMKTSKVIVAVNKDPEAPIFKVADYGIVGDLFEVLPLLKQELQKVKGLS